MSKHDRRSTQKTLCNLRHKLNKMGQSDPRLLFEHLEQRQVLSANWAGVFGGSGYDSANGIDVAADGATYIAGQFEDGTTIDFDLENNGGELTSQQSGNQRFPGQDGFLAKFDESGGFLWSIHAQNTSDIVVHDVAVDSQGNAFVVGHFRDEAAFYMDGVLQGSLTGSARKSGWDIFLAKFTNSGQLVWSEAVGGEGVQYAYKLEVVEDSFGAVETFVSGPTTGGGDFDPDPNEDTPLDPTDEEQRYLAKYRYDDAAGQLQLDWIQTDVRWFDATEELVVGVGANSFVVLDSQDGMPIASMDGVESENSGWRPGAAEIDGDDLVIVGRYHGTIDLDGDGVTDLFGDASESFFLSRLSFDATLPVGERFQVEWAQHHDGNGLLDLADSPSTGHLFLTGYFSGSLNFGGFELTSNESAQDGYLVTLDAETGDYLAAESFGGLGSERPSKSLLVGPHGEVALTGSTTSPTLTLPGSSNTFQLAGGGQQDMFVAVLTPATSSPPTANAGLGQEGQEGQLLTFNASASSDPDGDPLTYRWDFGDGTTAEATSPTVNHAYAYGGDFVVTLMVLDGNGNAATDTTTAKVSEVNDAPVADAGGPYSGFATQPVTFNASASFDFDNQDGSTANDQALQYFWDFGDGGTANTNVETVEYTYAAAGSYSVSLTVSDGIVSSIATAAASITTAPAGDPATIYVWNIEDLFETRQRGRNTDYRIVLDVFQDSDGDGVAEQSDGGISGVQVTVELRDASGVLLTTLTGETDSNGTFRSDWIKGLAPGQYSAEVIDLALESFNLFDGLLDVEDEQLLFV